MVDYYSFIIAIPVALVLVFIGLLVLWLIEDVFPAWKNANPLGSFEAWLFRDATRVIRKKKRNFVDLTEMAFTKKEGAILIENLVEESRSPDFHIPDKDRAEVSAILSKLAQFVRKNNIYSHGYPLVEWGNYEIRVIGIGSLLSKAEVAITLIRKGKSFPEDYVLGQSRGKFSFTGFRNRRFLIARQFYFPRRMKKFLGKRSVKVSMVFFVDPLGSNENSELMQTMRQMTINYAPVVEFLSRTHTLEDRLKDASARLRDQKRLLDLARKKGFTETATTSAVSDAMSMLEGLTGTFRRPIRGAVPAAALAVIPIASVIITDYGFTPNPSPIPVFGVVIGVLIAIPLFSRN